MKPLSATAVGTAGWNVPRAYADRFSETGSHLERYARRFNAVEINTSFYRSHRMAIYECWAASVPEHFRFSVKIPRSITHEDRLENVDEPLARFLDKVAGLGPKLGPLLLQLPPSLPFPDTNNRAASLSGEYCDTLASALKPATLNRPRGCSVKALLGCVS